MRTIARAPCTDTRAAILSPGCTARGSGPSAPGTSSYQAPYCGSPWRRGRGGRGVGVGRELVPGAVVRDPGAAGGVGAVLLEGGGGGVVTAEADPGGRVRLARDRAIDGGNRPRAADGPELGMGSVG